MHDLANVMFAQLSRYKKLKDTRFEELTSKYKLRKIDVEILFYLYSCGTKDTAKDIVDTDRFTKGHVSQSTKRLNEMGYITSKKDENDLRVLHLSLTDKSKEIIEAIYLVRTETFEAMFRGVSDEEIAVVERVCDIIRDNISRELK